MESLGTKRPSISVGQVVHQGWPCRNKGSSDQHAYVTALRDWKSDKITLSPSSEILDESPVRVKRIDGIGLATSLEWLLQELRSGAQNEKGAPVDQPHLALLTMPESDLVPCCPSLMRAVGLLPNGHSQTPTTQHWWRPAERPLSHDPGICKRTEERLPLPMAKNSPQPGD